MRREAVWPGGWRMSGDCLLCSDKRSMPSASGSAISPSSGPARDPRKHEVSMSEMEETMELGERYLS